MTCKRYHWRIGESDVQVWAWQWSPLPGSDALHRIAAMFLWYRPQPTA